MWRGPQIVNNGEGSSLTGLLGDRYDFVPTRERTRYALIFGNFYKYGVPPGRLAASWPAVEFDARGSVSHLARENPLVWDSERASRSEEDVYSIEGRYRAGGGRMIQSQFEE